MLSGVEHDRRRLVVAADWAITGARRTVAPGKRVRVPVAAVIVEAHDAFGMRVTRDQAAAVLRERLELRVAVDVVTDA